MPGINLFHIIRLRIDVVPEAGRRDACTVVEPAYAVGRIAVDLAGRHMELQDVPDDLGLVIGQTLRIACTLVEDNRQEVGRALVEKMPVLKDALGENGENGVMYYLKDAKADFFKMMELVETITF